MGVTFVATLALGIEQGILIGVVGSARRWRTMPWLVLIFGIMIIPLGAVSITFIIIQPIVIGTWCTLCLIGAAAMLLQIPYSVDEVVATIQFMRRRWKAGKGFWRILFVGDTDEDNDKEADEDFERGPVAIFREMLIGGMNLPWNLAALLVIGLWLMFTRLTVGAEGVMADADHLIGALVITFTVTATAEVARPVRFFNMPLGLALLLMPFLAGAPLAETLSAVICGLLIIGLSFPRGPVRLHYGSWTRYII